MQAGRVAPLVGLLVNEQFTAERVEPRLKVVLFLLGLLALRVQLRFAFLQGLFLVVRLGVAGSLGLQVRELVLYRVVAVEH